MLMLNGDMMSRWSMRNGAVPGRVEWGLQNVSEIWHEVAQKGLDLERQDFGCQERVVVLGCSSNMVLGSY